MRVGYRTGLAMTLVLLALPARADDEADRLRLARELIAVNQTMQQTEAMLPNIMNALKSVIARGDPKIEKDYDALIGLFYKELEPFKAQMAEDYARLQAKAFTKTELEEILAFSRSPTGQKMIQLTPSLAQAGMALGQQYGQRIGTQLAEKIKAELRKRGHNI